MKKYTKLVFALLACLLIFSIAACGKKADDSATSVSSDPILASDLIGSWKGTGEELSTVTFREDGTYRDDAGDIYISGTYEFDALSRTVTVHENEYGMTFTYYVTLSGNNLTMQISGGKVRTFSK
jgi:uncharacterized lipoprotein YehR (DUF1307 family)